jgi:galactoside O-acetyltransferase
MMTIRDKIKNGLRFSEIWDSLEDERVRCKELVYDYNHTRPGEKTRRIELLNEILGEMGENIQIEPPVHMAYGTNVHIGNNFYAKFNLVLVDDADIHIGNDVMIAPNVTITPTGYPIDPERRRPGIMFSIPVRIGNNVWIGSNAVILPGVTIGDNSVIGAGSVVTHDIPEDVVAVGNPCRVLRKITARDREYLL